MGMRIVPFPLYLADEADAVAAIRFKLTAMAANFDCLDTLNRPYPLARERP